MKAFTPIILAVALAVAGSSHAGDFFDLPIIVQKPPVATPPPVPVPATPAPAPPPVENPNPFVKLMPPVIPIPPVKPPEEIPSPRPGGPLTPTVFDPSILKTDSAAGHKDAGTEFRELAPAGAVLIGFDYAASKGSYDAKSGVSIKPKVPSLCPVYLLSNGGKKPGELHGETAPTEHLEAQPGYAVGAVAASGSTTLQGMQITFMKIKGRTLDPTDSYQSEWIGSDQANAKLLTGGGQPFIGLMGQSGREIYALAFLVPKGATSLPSTASLLPGRAPATPAPVPLPDGSAEIFACAKEEFTLSLNGHEILSGNSSHRVKSGIFPVAKGAVLTAVVKNNSSGRGWLSVRVVRDGKTALDASDMRYSLYTVYELKPTTSLSGLAVPKVWVHDKVLGTEPRTPAAWGAGSDAGKTTLYFKGVVP